MRRLRRTKIVATLGPASSEQAMIARLFEAGADVFRINMSHTTHDRMRELVVRWRSEFDHVIIDTPPVLGMSDAVVLSTLADAVVLVVRAAESGRQSVRRAREVLLGVNAKLAGVLVNAVDLNSMDHYGYYGYYAKEYLHYYGADEEKN